MVDAPHVGIVGTGRMGANIARRLNDVGYAIEALYDTRPEAARETAKDTGGEVVTTLAEATALSDVEITVVSDDAAMDRIFSEDPGADSLLKNAAGTIFIN